jgi:hypothetical protein
MVLAPPKRTPRTKRQTTKNGERLSIAKPTCSVVRCSNLIRLLFPMVRLTDKPTKRQKTGSIGDLFSQKTEMAKLISQPFPYYCHSRTCLIQWELQSFHRNDCLVVDNGWVGYLQEVDKENGTAIFHPLQLPSAQKARAEAYIAVRDVYMTCTKKKLKNRPNTRKKGKT